MRKLALGLLVVGACGGGSSKPKGLFQPKPECKGASVVPYMGSFPQVISSLSIGTAADGFDLDGDGKPDNKLAAVSSLAMSAIQSSFDSYQIVIPMEFFDLPTVGKDDCVKFAVYYGSYDQDGDGDGKRPGVAGGDCNDKDPNIHPGAAEIAGNGKDDNCDGLADESGPGMPNTTDTMDRDGDGQTVAQGDCDDTNPMVKKGMPEICGDGLDNDCDGVADRSVDANGNVTACSPFDPSADIALDKNSFDASGAPLVKFTDGTIDASGKLTAGPSTFSVTIPVMSGLSLDLEIAGAQLQADAAMSGSGMTLTNGKLGGVLAANTADTIRGLNVSQIGLTPDESLLDATFANVLGPLLALPKASDAVQKMYPGCRTPDIDVDGDGLEAFCDSNPNDTNYTVDVCIDGDGTVVKDTTDANGNVIQCTQAKDKNGKPRFVDGISVELNFATAPIHSIKPPAG